MAAAVMAAATAEAMAAVTVAATADVAVAAAAMAVATVVATAVATVAVTMETWSRFGVHEYKNKKDAVFLTVSFVVDDY